ncbi:MAG: DEAD/DEAH box helicase [Waddliaceae bacterium]
MTSPVEQLPNTYRVFFGSFPGLTPAQKQLIHPILNGKNVILQAGTGTGKTEAVLAPATENLIGHRKDYTIVYIVPTRALALDMNRRIQPIYQRLGLKAGMRTGDGKHLRGAEPHLLIMTPESLDVLLGSQNQDDKHFLQHVHVMIIDEVHAYVHGDRGHQLSYLHHRLEMQSLAALQTLVLSATIADPEEIIRFFKLKKNTVCYKQPATRKLQPFWVHLKDQERELTGFFDDLFLHWRCKKILVFANSRKHCEEIYNVLKREGLFSQKLFLHYSNLSTKERRFIESSFRNQKMGVCIATTTLELGIDIGDVDGVVLMGPPPSTTAFLQRIGRANRRCRHINFWGVCQGAHAGSQLVRFLALFELAKENQLETLFLSDSSYSVLFQQILSCLYAKKLLSEKSLKSLFTENSEDLHDIFHHMLANNWLKPTKHPELYRGGWRYYTMLQKRQIWSNFPPADEEYDVILNQEKIAALPLTTVKQLEMGDLIQLTGKVLKILRIEEREAAREVWVEERNEEPEKELLWLGCGIPIPFEVAQKMGAILLENSEPQGLLQRTQKLLEEEREKISRSVEQPNGMRVHRLRHGGYRYETWLGTVGNFLLHRLVKTQLTPIIERLSVTFDAMGIESNAWIPFFDTLKLPDTSQQFQNMVASYLPLLRGGFSWNRWLYYLTEEHQQKEISSRLLDPRVLKIFARYRSETTWLPLPENGADAKPAAASHHIALQGEPWSLEKEKNAWGTLFFPELPSEEPGWEIALTATQVQGYVTQKLCPRWARFQRLNFNTTSHPRFQGVDSERHSRKQQGIAFKKKVMEVLQDEQRVCRETSQFTWQEAIREVISTQKPLFLAQVKLEIEGTLKGIPDLLYIKHQETRICLEVWDIKYSHTVSYAQKWRVAFYAHLLDHLLKGETFLLPVKVSDMGGVVSPVSPYSDQYTRTPFPLSPYRSWMPRLIAQWKTDAVRCKAAQEYSMEPSCTSCRYFSYCYQETLFKNPPLPENLTIVSRNIDSNDFPKNTKHWFFIDYDHEEVQWQCWENGETRTETRLRLQDFSHEEAFRAEVAKQLQKEWSQSVHQRKNPHFLVYEPREWFFFQNAFQSTALKALWEAHTCWTAIQTVLDTHFSWPIQGCLTAAQVAACLGLLPDQQSSPLSMYHRKCPAGTPLTLYKQIWNWCLSKVKSQRVVSFEEVSLRPVSLITSYHKIHHREGECRMSEILEFQKNPWSERVQQCRSIGPIRFLGSVVENKQQCYRFSLDSESIVSKFRVGDFLKLSPLESERIQEGFSVILHTYSPEKGTLSVRSVSPKMMLSNQGFYILDESATDWNAPKIERVLTLLKDPNFRPGLIRLLLGHAKRFPSKTIEWAEQWYRSEAQAAGLNSRQKEALLLPFRENVGLIEGPPGTGKTHLLVWTLIALVAYANALNCRIKILVTAQTHHAIDQILKKVAKTLPSANVPSVVLWKYGGEECQLEKFGIRRMQESGPLVNDSSLILGATGFGVYQLLKKKKFPQLFDWVVFDEASQMLVPTALLSLIVGKGQAIFYGDTQQLSPVLMGNYANTSLIPRSILEELVSRYGAQNRLRLNATYRMHSPICRFVSEQWYDGELFSVANHEDRLSFPNYPLHCDDFDDYLDPAKSMVAVPLNHVGCRQSSHEEACWVANAVKRLIEDYSISADEIGIISPHRLQNNTILSALKKTLPYSLKLPRVDTVERMQGAEFDIVIFSATVSDKETIHSPFLKEYRRFNVALTRSRKKFILVASTLFFQSFPMTEKTLIAQTPFEDFFHASFGPKNEMNF